MKHAQTHISLREEERPHVHSLHAATLHLPGIDHDQLAIRHDGRDERLTDVAGEVIKKGLS